MDVTPLIPAGRQIIQSYRPGRFSVTGQAYDGPILVFPDETHSWTVTGPASALTLEDFSPLIACAGKLDVVLLGCGPAQAAPPLPLRTALKEKGLTVEMMDTGAACRTYNVLMAEDRRVVAALLPV